MQEHERQDYERLRAEGRWSEANEFREAERRRLRALGRSKQQARDESWALMLKKFPPRGPADSAQPSLADAARESPESLPNEHDEDAEFADELEQLRTMTQGKPTDADRDIDFAYRHMGLDTLTPLSAPSVPAWEWHRYAQRSPGKFLDVVAKREDAKSKMSGTINEKRMLDDKRQKFAVIDRLKSSLQCSIVSVLKESWERWPDLTRAALRETGWWHESELPASVVSGLQSKGVPDSCPGPHP